MASAPLASTSQLSSVDPAPPTILSLAHGLSASINATFHPVSSSGKSFSSSSTRLLHPFGPLDPQQVATTRQQASTTLTHLRQAINEFASLLPPPPTSTFDTTTTSQSSVPSPIAPSPPTKPHPQLDKYLTVLKEASMHQGALSNWLSTELATSKRVLQLFTADDSIPVMIPKVESGLERTVQTLQGIAKGLGLVSFREGNQEERDKTMMMTTTTTTTATETETLSLGGKVMVVDFVISTRQGQVDKVNVSYVMDAGQVDRTDVAASLQKCLHLLGGAGTGAGEGEEEEGGEALRLGLQACRRILRELTRLDTMTEQSGVDAFMALERIEQACKLVLSQGEGESETTTTKFIDPTLQGILLPRIRDHLPRIIYHATPLVQMTDRWTQALENNFQQDLTELLSMQGVGTLSIHLEKPEKPTLIPSAYVDRVEEQTQGGSTTTMFDAPAVRRVRYLEVDRNTAPWFVARFESGVGISKEVGRRIGEVLGEANGAVSIGTEAVLTTGTPVRAGRSTLTELLLSKRPLERVDALDLSARYKVSFDDLPMAQEYALDRSSRVPGYLLTNIRFQAPEQLFKVLKIIRAQARINALVQSVFHPRYLVTKPDTINGELDKVNLSKRRKIEVTTPRSLEDILGSIRSTLPIFVQIRGDSSITLSFPSPSGPAELAKPLALHISSSSSEEEDEQGYQLRFEGVELDVSKAKEVLDLTGDLRLLMRWVVKTLG
ncbi:BQ2448_6113 [Microbotryum intermedium]|uniref:Mediator of RNA polymerase II transcription subunit 1 n=1 Tax=Microbotryum intermedium TaxID=269621 RepID=A0A238FNV5_9BASI|nr:BQ2448_6113 [Microbotryum intermedium]